MPELQVVVSNRTEALVEALCERLQHPAERFAPTDRERIVVGGRGMAVWLNLEIARRLGVASAIEYLYPRNVVAWALSELLPAATRDDPYRSERLLWAVLAKLPEHLEQPEFEGIARYLEGDVAGSKRFQLCQRIAGTFDEYLTYRPELLERWTRAKPGRQLPRPQLSLFGSATSDASEQWQQRLWRAVRPHLGDAHPALRLRQLEEAPLPDRVNAERVSVFGLSTLPPLFLHILARLAHRVEVDLYALNATVPEKRKGRNPLLVSSGVIEREFSGLLAAAAEQARTTISLARRFVAPTGEGLLHQLQREWLDDDASEHLSYRSNDGSIAFHSCHGPTREVEVLHDQLLHLIRECDIAPHEVVVMAPDIDAYAPLVQAVFERSTDDPLFIPYRISDRKLPADSQIIDGLLNLLSLVRTRLSSAQVLDFLTGDKVRERFAISAEDLETLRRWVTESGARWGIDPEHRARFGVPAEPENTWQFALDRLLLGYAIDTDGRELSLGVLPYGELEGKAGELLGRFTQFVTTLFRCSSDLEQPRTLADWQGALSRTLAELFSFDQDSAWQHQLVLTALGELVSVSESCGFSDPLELEVVTRLLTNRLDQERAARGFLSGGVTFCAMTPMRSIPFRVVWLLGMNDGAFPRSTFRPDFSLLERSSEGRRPGDPERRLDDRCLFLECLLSARERFVASFVGQSIRNNQELPPSVVLSELLDTLVDRAIDETGRRLTREEIVVRHPLQPFSPRYYTGAEPESRGSLYSFEQSYLRGAELLAGERRPTTPLFDTALEPEVEPKIALGELVRFFERPVETLLRRRLGLDLRDREIDVPEREPSVLDGLETYQVGALALAHRRAEMTPERSEALIRASGILPTGAAGSYEYQRAFASAEPIAERARRVGSIRSHDHLVFQLRLDEHTELEGDLGEVFARGLLHVQFARLGARHLLGAWLRHLVLCALRPKGVTLASNVLGRPEGDGVRHVSYRAVAEPIELLESLVQRYRHGLCTPLLLFPEASYAHATRERGLKRASVYSSWKEELQRSPALQRVFGKGVTLLEHGPEGTPRDVQPNFAELSREIFGPLLDHLEEQS